VTTEVAKMNAVVWLHELIAIVMAYVMTAPHPRKIGHDLFLSDAGILFLL